MKIKKLKTNLNLICKTFSKYYVCKKRANCFFYTSTYYDIPFIACNFNLFTDLYKEILFMWYFI